jgi:uncharacterized paraquat-inducible protein A
MKPNALTTDTAMQATLLANVIRAQRIPHCPMCAEARKVREIEGEQYIVCPRCGDAEKVSR